MSETPQETLRLLADLCERMAVEPTVSVVARAYNARYAEAIRAVLAENASVNRVAGHLSDLATWWVGKAGQLEAEVASCQVASYQGPQWYKAWKDSEAERDALRDEVKRREAECWAGAEEVVKLRAEVERLRAEGLAIADGQIADRERLEAEVARLSSCGKHHPEPPRTVPTLEEEHESHLGSQRSPGLS